MKKNSRAPLKWAILFMLTSKILVITLFITYFKPFRSDSTVIMQNILSRSSVRNFEARMPGEAEIELLLRAAMAAPSSRDVRPWQFYIIRDRAILDSLAASLPSARMLAEAPLAIVVAGDTQKGSPNEEQIHNWIMDCSAATQNLLLAAHSLGLGAVWTGVYPYAERISLVRQALSLPDHIIPLNVIPLGYARGEFPARDKWDPSCIHGL